MRPRQGDVGVISKELQVELIDVIRELYTAAMEVPEPYDDLSPEDQSHANQLLSRFENLQDVHGALPYAELLHPMLLSKNGRYEEALALTRECFEVAPSWESAVAYANAARRADNLDLAVQMFSAASQYDPEDVTCWLEVGDIHLEREMYSEALAGYEKVLETDSSHPWALPSAFYCRHQLGVEGNWLASLNEVANQEGCTCGLEGCLTGLFGGYGSSDAIGRAQYLLAKSG